MKHSDDARQAIHDWRWGPYIDDPIERQEVADAMIATIMDAFNQLEAKNAKLKRENEASLELLEEGRDLILRMRSKLGGVGMWETILGRMDALLTEQEQANE